MEIMETERTQDENRTLSFLRRQGKMYALRVSYKYYQDDKYWQYWLEYCYTAQDYASESFIKVRSGAIRSESWGNVGWEKILAGLQMEVLEIFCGSDLSFARDLPEPQKMLKRLHIAYHGYDYTSLLRLNSYIFPALEELSVVRKRWGRRNDIEVGLSGYFPHLRKVELRGTRVDLIGLLSCLSPNSLEELSLDNCGNIYKRGEVPDFAPVELSDFYRLRVLRLSGNRLKALSFMPHTMPALEVLDIRGNRYCTVPSALLWLPRLRGFHFSRTLFSRESHILRGRDWIRIARYGRARLSLQEMDLLHDILTTSPAYSPLTDQQQWLRFYRLIPVASFRRLLWMIFSTRFGGDVEQVYLSASALHCAFVGKMPRRWLRKHMEGSRLCRVPLSEAETVFVGEGLSGKQVAWLLSTGKRIFTLDNLKRLYPHFPSLYLYQDKNHETDHLMTLWERQEDVSSCVLVERALVEGGLPRKFFFRLWGALWVALWVKKDRVTKEGYMVLCNTPLFWSVLRHYLSSSEYDFLATLRHELRLTYAETKGYTTKASRLRDVRSYLSRRQFLRFFSGEFPFLRLSVEEFYELFYQQGYWHLPLYLYVSCGRVYYGNIYGWLAGMLLSEPSHAPKLWRFYVHPLRGSIDVSWLANLGYVPRAWQAFVLRIKVLGDTARWCDSVSPRYFFSGNGWKVCLMEVVCADEDELAYWFEKLYKTTKERKNFFGLEAGYVPVGHDPCPCYNDITDGWRMEVYLHEKRIFSTDKQCNILWFAEEEWRRKLEEKRQVMLQAQLLKIETEYQEFLDSVVG